MKKSGKRLSAGLAAVLGMTACLLAGCGSRVASTSEKESLMDEATQTEVAAESMTETESQQAADTGDWEFGIIEDNTVKNAALLLTTQLSENRGDYEEIRKLCTEDSSEENVQYVCDNFADISKYDQHNVLVLGQNGDIYYVDVVSYIVSGSVPNTSEEDRSYQFLITKEKGDWKLDCNPDSIDAFNQAAEVSPLLPEEGIAASQAGRNAAQFNTNLMYTDTESVFRGCVTGKILFAWQEENGDVTLDVWIANDTSENISIQSEHSVLTDESLGTILDHTGGLQEIVPAGTSARYLLTVPASEVKTGTQQWGSVNSSIDYSWK